MKKFSCFVEVGAYLPEKIFGTQKSIEFVKNSLEDGIVLGGYRNGNGPLEVGITKIFTVPEKEEELKVWKNNLSKEYYREKEIFIAKIEGQKPLVGTLESFMENIGPGDGFSLKYENNQWHLIELDFESSYMLPMYENRYNRINIEEMTHKQIELLVHFDEYAFEELDIFISEDNKSGFLMDNNKVVDMFSLVDGRENELLVAMQLATPQTGKEYLDITPIVSNITNETLEKQQVMINQKDRALMYSTLIDFNKIITDDLKPYQAKTPLEKEKEIEEFKVG